ncbi:MAG: AAA family ATPase [Candidatus Margulisbacteria bacterium]|jgi:DNA polymerase III delta prime subunit|nr:AAA family ATPase [Candidatus Margulisiibacteriota bacterium]
MSKRAGAILQGIIQTGRVANAYLFAGPPGSGRTAAAREFFKGLNKLAKTSVDYHELRTEKASIPIEQIRELRNFVRYGPREQKFLMVVIQNAEKLVAQGKAEAANAFLKLLEEPPEGVVFILETASRDALPATILSRCQTIIFEPAPDNSEPGPQFAALKDFVLSIKSRDFAQIGRFVETLGREKEELRDSLLRLAQYYKEQFDWRKAGLILEYVRIMRSNVNLKLTLEVMLLKIRDL